MPYSDTLIPRAAVEAWAREFRDVERLSKKDQFTITAVMTFDDAKVQAIGKSGVYLMYREGQTLTYIGMSLKCLGTRLRAHGSRRELASAFWRERPSPFAQLIEVNEPWEAPSLEEYLIQRANRYPNGN